MCFCLRLCSLIAMMMFPFVLMFLMNIRLFKVPTCLFLYIRVLFVLIMALFRFFFVLLSFSSSFSSSFDLFVRVCFLSSFYVYRSSVSRPCFSSVSVSVASA